MHPVAAQKTVSAALGAEPEGGVAKHKLARLEQVKVISAAGEGDLPGNEAKLKEVLGHTPVQVRGVPSSAATSVPLPPTHLVW